MRDFRRLTAGAVETSMSATCTTILRKGLAKMFACAMEPDGQIVLRKPELRSDFPWLLSVKVDLLEQITVLLRDHGQEAFETLAQNAFVPLARRLGKLLLKPFQRPAPSSLPAVNINDGAPENAVEPGGGLLLSFGLALRGQGLHKAFLHHVFCHVRVTETASRECHKNFQIPQQRGFE